MFLKINSQSEFETAISKIISREIPDDLDWNAVGSFFGKTSEKPPSDELMEYFASKMNIVLEGDEVTGEIDLKRSFQIIINTLIDEFSLKFPAMLYVRPDNVEYVFDAISLSKVSQIVG